MIKTFFLILTYVSISAGLFSNMDDEEIDWKLSKTKDEITIFTRRVDYSNYKEFKCEMILSSNPETIISHLKNIEEYKDWLPDCMESKKLEAISNIQQINYILTDVPWPYEDRDLAYKFSVVPMDYISGQLKVLIENKPEYIPTKKKIVRIPRSNGFWIITPLVENQTKVVYQMHVEPGGFVPAWLYNMKIVDTPYGFMNNLREQLGKEKSN